ncbi:hypothetical protein PPMP20_21875 [Paraburkholderia phymatum]|uniref:Uncharacterized protein n=1 Tax=Paraburkholderia phymatum (strain DSM 17167 / CIP 108236 / LMG 21445 / STM815) TaxID=391038 RepID=B2JMY6_PARP8|nr:hypothetical protein [Paraburkholderia phymatum]ACC74379.1 hypothetical protein Bphy_5301 [Paraburkholderia phymatum STM815]
MKNRSAECLLFVAIVTTAVVAPIRERTLPSAPADMHTNTAAQSSGTRSCEDGHGVLLRAACATTRGERRSGEGRSIDSGDRPINRIDRPYAGKLWV